MTLLSLLVVWLRDRRSATCAAMIAVFNRARIFKRRIYIEIFNVKSKAYRSFQWNLKLQHKDNGVNIK